MRLLDAPYPSRPSPLAAGTPRVLVLVLVGMLAAATVLFALRPSALPQRLAVMTLHSALLVTAIGWAAHDGRWHAGPLQATIVAVVAAAGAGAFADRRAGFLYLAVGGTLVVAGARGRLEPLGGRRVSAGWLAAGVAVGAALGVHLLATASRTVHFHVRATDATGYAAALAYDVGLNVPSAEGFFRGALFQRLQRRTSLAAAAAVSSAACVVRYVLDPQLPATVETVAGAVFYVLVLSIANAWLLWRTGSLLPGIGAAVMFFAAWRLIVVS